MEAISLFAAATLILTIFMMYFGTQIATHAEEREFESLRDLSGTIRQEILLARQAGPGYERTLIIPSPGSEKRVIFTVEYPPVPGFTELTVRFEPPISDALEASEVLGEGVYGYFSSGTNTIRTHPGGIIVEPDPGAIQDLLDDGLIQPLTPEIAFAHLNSDTVRLIDPIECEYGVANDWAHDNTKPEYIDIAWISREGLDEQCFSDTIDYGDRAMFNPSLAGIDLSKGRNLSCAARYRQDSAPPLCTDLVNHNYNGPRIARSSEALIVNSPPEIAVHTIPPVTGTDDLDARNTTWTNIAVRFNVTDSDSSDDKFNVSLVKDGTNANYIECTPCVWNQIDKDDDQTMRISLTVPWPEGEHAGCDDINRLSFKLRAIEADSTSELYTLKAVDISDELRCP